MDHHKGAEDRQKPFNEVFDEVEFEHDSIVDIFVVQYIMLTVQVVATILGLISCGLYSYVICKIQLLQTRTNYILLNCFVCMLIKNITWIAFQFILAFGFCHNLQESCLQILHLNNSLGMVLNSLFVLLALDWYISANCNTLFSKYNKAYTFILVCLYLLGVINYFVNQFAWFKYGSVGSYFIYCLVIIILYINRSLRTYPPEALKISYALTISSVYFLMWAPFMVVVVTEIFVSYVCPDETFTASITALLTVYAFLTIGNLSPLVIAIVLRNLDKNFKRSYYYVFRRSVRKYTRTNLNLEDTEDFTDSEVA